MLEQSCSPHGQDSKEREEHLAGHCPFKHNTPVTDDLPQGPASKRIHSLLILLCQEGSIWALAGAGVGALKSSG